MKKENKTISIISKKVATIKKNVSRPYNTDLQKCDFLQNVEYLPNPFDIADFYGIKYKFIKMDGEMPSYLSYEVGKSIIYISDKYKNDNYNAKILCAHELGHWFMHDSQKLRAMNNDLLNLYLPQENTEEYEANVFAILLMPQIMCGQPWETYSPRKLNRLIYDKVIK